jgi:hypothetical protein
MTISPGFTSMPLAYFFASASPVLAFTEMSAKENVYAYP